MRGASLTEIYDAALRTVKDETLECGIEIQVHDIPGGVAFGIGMPGVDVRMHGANERYPVEDLYTSAEIFAAAIAEICG